MKRIELLSPAGNFESLKFAVQNGADAVYLGLNKFSARASSDNFDIEKLKQAISYAHPRGVLVYVAINTLLDDNDLENAIELAKMADMLHADAFIVQDLGLARMLKKHVKAPLHASTQMTVYNEEGARLLKDLGFSRCILSRELSLDEIVTICSKNIMEMEVFCHGAICISYSGQCLLSSAIGGRSGNKGQCAQPCRLMYSVLRNGKEVSKRAYRISPGDLMTLPYLAQLVNTGITSLKIEGRLKSPQYTGIVTAKYRKALDIIQNREIEEYPTQKDMEDLSVIFSRGRFTSYHHFEKMPFADITFSSSGHIGLECGEILKVKIFKTKGKRNSPDIFELKVKLSSPVSKGDGIAIENTEDGGKVNSIKTESHKTILSADAGDTVILNLAGRLKNNVRSGMHIYKTHDEQLSSEINQKMQKENRKVPVSVHAGIKQGSPVIITMSDGKYEVSASGNLVVEKALNRAVNADDVTRQMSKLGGTVFELDYITVDIDENIFVPMSELANIRRELVEKLMEKRTEGAI